MYIKKPLKSKVERLFVGVKEENVFNYRLCRWRWDFYPVRSNLIKVVYADKPQFNSL
jgi:hypothetical protein